MKNFLTTKLLFLAVLLCGMSKVSFAQAANDADPALTSMSFASSPVIEGFTTSLTVSFVNAGFSYTIHNNQVGLNISLPTSGDYVAFPAVTGAAHTIVAGPFAALSGSGAAMFTWTYDVDNHTFIGRNNQDIVAGAGGPVIVTVKGVISSPTGVPVLSTANIQRYNPTDYPHENTTNNSLTGGLGVAPGGVVTVGLLNFNAAPQGKAVSLDWQTSSEINSRNFDVEFSIDGVKFNKIGTVATVGNSTTPTSYSFLHTTPINGLNYYRLKQVDQDGSFKYSVIRTVKFGTRTAVYPMPNPTTDGVALISNVAGTVKSVMVYSMDGKKMQQIENYSYGKTIDMSRYAPATYLLRVTNQDGTTEVFQVLKK